MTHDYHPQTPEELAEHYRRLKARLYKTPARPVVIRPRFEEPAPEPASRDLHYDSDFHVACWRMFMLDQSKLKDKVWLNVSGAKKIAIEACDRHGVTNNALISGKRSLRVVLARQEICYRLREEMKWTFQRIGSYLGGKDHTTVLHGYKRHAERIARGELDVIPARFNQVKECGKLELAADIVRMHRLGLSNQYISHYTGCSADQVREIVKLEKSTK